MDTVPDQITTVRIYFCYGQQVKGKGFWNRLLNNNLGALLLKKAREIGIGQAAIYTPRVGYLPSGKISVQNFETTSVKHPACLELFDSTEKLQDYLALNKDYLADTRTILLNDDCYQFRPTV